MVQIRLEAQVSPVSCQDTVEEQVIEQVATGEAHLLVEHGLGVPEAILIVEWSVPVC